jgi:hypothetical protein
MANAAACGINFQNVRPFIGRVQNRLGAKLYNNLFRDHPRGEENSVLQAVSAIFGINEANDSARLGIVDRAILPRLMEPANSKFLHRTIDALTGYAGWTGSGAHRFMPVAVVVGNILKGNSIFSQEIIADMQPDVRDYLRSNHPFYSSGLQDEDLPQLKIRIPDKEVYLWLDIASAPKTGGAPTLNTLSLSLNKLFPDRFLFHGVDIAFPLYELTPAGKINPSKYCSEDTQMLKSEAVVKGITYHNALLDPRFQILSDRFSEGESVDIVSMCMVLPQMAGRDPRKKMPFTSQTVSGSPGFDPELNLADIQQRAIDAALKRLAVGGIFIGDMRSQLPADSSKEESLNNNQEGMLFVIQRNSRDSYTIFDRYPIVFSTDPKEYLPSVMMGFIKGYKHPKPVFNHCGISACYPGLSEQQIQSLRSLFVSADRLALRHQGWKKSAWGRAFAVIEGIKTQSPLPQLLKTYLENVPDDLPQKLKLLESAGAVEREITNAD